MELDILLMAEVSQLTHIEYRYVQEFLDAFIHAFEISQHETRYIQGSSHNNLK